MTLTRFPRACSQGNSTRVFPTAVPDAPFSLAGSYVNFWIPISFFSLFLFKCLASRRACALVHSTRILRTGCVAVLKRFLACDNEFHAARTRSSIETVFEQ